MYYQLNVVIEVCKVKYNFPSNLRIMNFVLLLDTYVLCTDHCVGN